MYNTFFGVKVVSFIWEAHKEVVFSEDNLCWTIDGSYYFPFWNWFCGNSFGRTSTYYKLRVELVLYWDRKRSVRGIAENLSIWVFWLWVISLEFCLAYAYSFVISIVFPSLLFIISLLSFFFLSLWWLLSTSCIFIKMCVFNTLKFKKFHFWKKYFFI